MIKSEYIRFNQSGDRAGIVNWSDLILGGPSRFNKSAVNSSGEKLVGGNYSEHIQVKRAYRNVEERGVVEW